MKTFTEKEAWQLLRQKRSKSKSKKVDIFFFLDVSNKSFIIAPKGTTMKTNPPDNLEVTRLSSYV